MPKTEEIIAGYLIDLRTKLSKYDTELILPRLDYLSRMTEALLCVDYKNILLIGYPGTGKTEMVYSFIHHITKGSVSEFMPPFVKNSNIFELNLLGIVANTTLRGQLEQRLKAMLDYIVNNSFTILFIDEIHTASYAGESLEGKGILHLIKPYIITPNLVIIGTTTFEDYYKHIEKDGAIVRRFHKIKIEEPDKETTIKIITKRAEKYQLHHGIKTSREVIENIIKLTDIYMPMHHHPAKDIQVLDLACAHASYNNYISPLSSQYKELEKQLLVVQEEKEKYVQSGDFEKARMLREKEEKIVEAMKNLKDTIYKITDLKIDDIKYAIETITSNRIISINIGDIMVNIKNTLYDSILGQNNAIEEIIYQIEKYFKFKLYERRPLSLLLAGPTGTGKTETAYLLAETLLGDRNKIVRIDMSEYADRHSIYNLIGAPPGYIGYESSGILHKKLKESPFNIILFDEIEKAHPEIQNILLNLLDGGNLIDNHHNIINAKSSIFIITTNLGSQILYAKPIGFASKVSNKDIQNNIYKSIQKYFKPEVLGRIDKIVIFNSLSIDTIKKIVVNHINKITEQLGIEKDELTEIINEIDLDKLIQENINENLSARDIMRIAEKHLMDMISIK